MESTELEGAYLAATLDAPSEVAATVDCPPSDGTEHCAKGDAHAFGNCDVAPKKISWTPRNGTFSKDGSVIVETFESMQLRRKLLQSFPELYISTPTELQKQTLFHFFQNENVFVQCYSGVGMGKRTMTAICVLQKINWKLRCVQAVVVTKIKSESTMKTSTLATVRRIDKIRATIEAVGKYAGVKCASAPPTHVLEDAEVEAQIAAGARVLVGTAARVNSIIRRRVIDPFAVRLLVLEEADEVIDEDVDEEGHDIDRFSKIYAAMPDDIQVLVIASVLTPVLGDFMYAKDFQPVRVAVEVPFDKVRHFWRCVTEETKEAVLMDLLSRFFGCGKIVVFTRWAEKAVEFRDAFAHEGALYMHYDNQKSERYETMSQFVAGNMRLLFATDNLPFDAIQGGEISLIINFDFPTRRNYVHRFYRAGLLKCGGDVISLVVESDLTCMNHVIDFYNIKMDILQDDYVPPVLREAVC